MRQVPGMAVTVGTRLVELPGRGVTRVWECPGPRGADTLLLIHGVTFTAELNWGRVFAPLAPHFRVVAIDLRGHGDGISAGARFRLEDCADDIAALAQVSCCTGGTRRCYPAWCCARPPATCWDLRRRGWLRSRCRRRPPPSGGTRSSSR